MCVQYLIDNKGASIKFNISQIHKTACRARKRGISVRECNGANRRLSEPSRTVETYCPRVRNFRIVHRVMHTYETAAATKRSSKRNARPVKLCAVRRNALAHRYHPKQPRRRPKLPPAGHHRRDNPAHVPAGGEYRFIKRLFN